MEKVRLCRGGTGRSDGAEGAKLDIGLAQDSWFQIEILVAPIEMRIDLATVVRSSHVDHSY